MGSDHSPVVNHLLSAAGYLFRRLKGKFHVALQVIAALAEQVGHRKAHSHVPIVAAGMHQAFHLRRVRSVHGLLHWQTVHIYTNQNGRASARTLQLTQDTGLSHSGAHVPAEAVQPFGDHPGGAVFLECELRVPVEVSAVLHQPFSDASHVSRR